MSISIEKTSRKVLTYEDAQEVLHKLFILMENEDAELPDGSEFTQAQRDELRKSLPREAGEWSPPEWAVELVREEMRDHCLVLRDNAHDARSNREIGQALRIFKQAIRLEEIFGL